MSGADATAITEAFYAWSNALRDADVAAQAAAAAKVREDAALARLRALARGFGKEKA